MVVSFAGTYANLHPKIAVGEYAKIMDWAGIEPATFRLRSEHYYP